MIPPLVNTFIGFFKDTSLVLIIGIFDLLTAGKTAIVEPAWQGFGVEDAKVQFRLTYGLIAWMVMPYPDLRAHARIALRYKARRRAA